MNAATAMANAAESVLSLGEGRLCSTENYNAVRLCSLVRKGATVVAAAAVDGASATAYLCRHFATNGLRGPSG